MLLTYDVGNTNIVVGLFDGDDLVGHWRFTTDRHRTGDELRLTTRSLLAEAEVDVDRVEGIVVASVVPSLTRPLRAGLEPFVHAPVRFLDANSAPIRLDVEQPCNVGADRIANSVAGHRLYGGPLLVLDFGTAINFDLVSKDGAFLGGAIAPAMRLAARALTSQAAQLHAVELIVPDGAIGKTTATNLQSGIVLGYLDLVDGLISRFRREFPEPFKVLVTGGDGALFHRELESIDLYDPFLTLKGLRICWEAWASESPRPGKADPA